MEQRLLDPPNQEQLTPRGEIRQIVRQIGEQLIVVVSYSEARPLETRALYLEVRSERRGMQGSQQAVADPGSEPSCRYAVCERKRA